VTDASSTTLSSSAVSQTLSISEAEFQSIRKLVYDNFGINLTEQKKALIVGRLQKVLRKRQLSSIDEYCNFLINEKSGEALEELANQISTNHTYFYREKDHFDYFKKVILPEVEERYRNSTPKDLRIWCAGCSSGEEPYTLVMILLQHFGMNYSSWEAGILATDISAKVLKSAVTGKYDVDRLRNVPPELLSRYFKKEGNDEYLVSDTLRKEITFRRHNLMNEKFNFKRRFDAIFCRNVMIYFDTKTRNELVSRSVQILYTSHPENTANCPFLCHIHPSWIGYLPCAPHT